MKRIDRLLHKALQLADQPETGFLQLARCLAQLHGSDPGSISRFVSLSGTGRRKTYYLRRVGEQLTDLGLAEGRLERIGWTKLQVISEKLTPKSAERWLRLAEIRSTQELVDLVRGGPARPHCVQLYFGPRQYAQLERAILNHGGQRRGRGLANKEAAIMRMVRRASKGASQQQAGQQKAGR